VGHLYFGAVGYADDVSFIAPSIFALRKMSSIALNFAKEYDIKFNPLKCQLINYSKTSNVSFDFDGVALKAESKGIHLGHTIGPNVSYDAFQDAAYTLIRNTNSALYNFPYCSYDVKFELFRSYCTSYYGSQLWDITDKHAAKFYVSWRKALRKIFDLPYRTHCEMLPIIANCMPIEYQISCRIVKFISNSLSSQNMHVQFLMNLVTRGSRSSISVSFNHILAKCKLSVGVLNGGSMHSVLSVLKGKYYPGDNTLRAALFARDVALGREYPQLLGRVELEDILHHICVQ
jgi:hypothetical protein